MQPLTKCQRLHTTLNTATGIALALYAVLPLSLLPSHPGSLYISYRDTAGHRDSGNVAHALSTPKNWENQGGEPPITMKKFPSTSCIA